ncbi:Gfo/Idh/MocA family oxidoreductase [Chryseolinea sp. H1M3-3]|uniref:Gfo/Idh/MocA family protein n=1 Tax=Chryseolinea sp. H1M3-3 TaxID=3034144 RepID=UPI0023EBEDC8|nr:Gfo/Idh/MocA family oxidoreductase [Chryseolinea sp. H1M3-3]
MKQWNRRKFIQSAIAGSIGAGLTENLHAFNILPTYPVKDKYKVAIMGVNARGLDHVRAFLNQPNAEIAYICDVDTIPLSKAMELASKGKAKPKSVSDFRRALDDKTVDALSIAAPDHWHAPAAILGLKAGKHIYVEKPGSHNPGEAELLVDAMKKYDTKIVQMGNQRRSWPRVKEAIQSLHDGVIGRVYYARAWYTNTRPSIGKGKLVAPPVNLDYELWQGPAPRKPYKDNLIHYNWHWHWNWGTGEVLNNGTHFIDLARWGLDVNYPTKVFSTGGRYQYQDDWETPDTQIATFDFEGGKTIAWEGRSCNQRGINNMGSGVSFHGEQGTLELQDNSYKIFDNKGNVVKNVDSTKNVEVSQTGPGFNFDKDHFANFLDCMETGKKPNSIYNDCYKSVLLCHLANISYRTGRALQCDAENGRIKNDTEATKLWTREYENGWQPSIT